MKVRPLAQLPTVAVAISANTDSVNLRTLAGAPGYACRVVCTVAQGVVIGDGGSQGAAFKTGTGWSDGTVLVLVNKGSIEGKGGRYSVTSSIRDGGHAIQADYALAIDNSNGYIKGGGGCGGPGMMDGSGASEAQGGGSGGGQGNPGGTGAVANGTGATGSSGSSGSRTAPGAGGAGGKVSAYNTFGGTGGTGGRWGSAGMPSLPNGAGNASSTVGAGGKAVRTIAAVTWLGGYNSTQVLGAVA